MGGREVAGEEGERGKEAAHSCRDLQEKNWQLFCIYHVQV